MDSLASNAYLSVMFARIPAILALLAIAVVTTIGAGHAARMDGMTAGHAGHPGMMMHAAVDPHPSGESVEHCGSGDAAMCEFVCTGLSVFLTMPAVDAGHASGSAGHDFSAEAGDVGRAPGLNERPPKRRLL